MLPTFMVQKDQSVGFCLISPSPSARLPAQKSIRSDLGIALFMLGNAASNVIPGQASAAFKLRFNDLHTSDSVEDWLRDRLDQKGADYDLQIRVSGESFLCPPGPLSDLIARAVETVLGTRPELGTTGGTSDARFIKDYAPVAELGLLNTTAHKVDERVSVADLERLSTIYGAVLDGTYPQ